MGLERRFIYEDKIVRIAVVKGTGELPPHTHDDEVEIAVPLKGKFRIVIEGVEHKPEPCSPLRIEAGKKHYAVIEDGEAVAIFIKKSVYS